MVEFLLQGVSLNEVLAVMETISPRKYWLHNRAGGEGWDVSFGFTITVRVADERNATFIMLRLKR